MVHKVGVACVVSVVSRKAGVISAVRVVLCNIRVISAVRFVSCKSEFVCCVYVASGELCLVLRKVVGMLVPGGDRRLADGLLCGSSSSVSIVGRRW